MLSPTYTENNSTTRFSAQLKEPFKYVPALVESANSNCFVFSLTNDGIVQYASDNVSALLGINSRDIVGHSFDEFLSDDPVNERVRAKCWQVIPNNAVLNCQCELLNKDGTMLSADMRCSGIYEDDEIIGLVAFVQSQVKEPSDSEEKQQERARVKKLVDQLSGAEREVVDLVVAGHMNKSMAKMLGVAVRTIEARRSRAMTKLQVRSLPDLVKTWLLYTGQ